MKRMFTQVAAWWLPALLLMITSTAFADTEPNDDLAGANPLEIDQEQTGTLGIPTGDTDDYYVINLTANGDLTITGNYDQGLTGFIYLYNSAGTQLGYTSGGTGDKSLTVHCIASGNVYVRASRNGGSGSYS